MRRKKGWVDAVRAKRPCPEEMARLDEAEYQMLERLRLGFIHADETNERGLATLESLRALQYAQKLTSGGRVYILTTLGLKRLEYERG